MSEARIRELLVTYAQAYVDEGDEWTEVFQTKRHLENTPYWDMLRDAYRQTVEATEELKVRTVRELISLGYPIRTWQITGQSSSDGMDHYSIDRKIREEFGDQVETDSESGQIFMYVTESVREEVFNRVRDLVGVGLVTLNSGDSYPVWVELEEMEPKEYAIPGLGSWNDAQKFLKGIEK